MSLLKQTKEWCEQYKIRPSRYRGQNFLIAENVYAKIIAAAELNTSDTVLEVGPGFGFLTAKLAQKTKQVLAVEVDKGLAAALGDNLRKQAVKNVKIIHGDVLKLADKYLPRQPYKIVANLPYSISAHFLRLFLADKKNKPQMLVLLLQREVVDRILARPGEMSILAVATQFYADIKKVASVPPGSFWPQPRVQSAIVKLTLFDKNFRAVADFDEAKFFSLVRIGFSARRKQLKNNLAKLLTAKQNDVASYLCLAGLAENIRAQDLSIADWQNLYVVLSKRNVL